MQGLDYIPCFIGRPIIYEKDETILSHSMRTYQLMHLLLQHISGHMQSRFLIITRNHKCQRWFAPHRSVAPVLRYFTCHR